MQTGGGDQHIWSWARVGPGRQAERGHRRDGRRTVSLDERRPVVGGGNRPQ